jgi:O-antigen/teichoic acid export membrane protein
MGSQPRSSSLPVDAAAQGRIIVPMATDQQQTTLAGLEGDLLDTPAAGPAAIRGSALRVIGYGLGVVLSLISVPLLIHHLGVAEYGRYVLVISIVTVVQGVTDVGLGAIGVREYSIRRGADRTKLMRNLLGLRVVLTSIGMVLGMAFAAIAQYGHAVLYGTIFAGIATVLAVAQGTLIVPLSAQLRLGWVTALDLLRQVLSVAAIVALVITGAQLIGFLAVMIPVALIVLAATVLLVRGTMPMRPSLDRKEWVLLLRAVLPFAAAVVIATLYLRVTVILMSLLASELQTGYYATSFTVISVLIAIPALTVGSALPILSRAARDDPERFGYVIQRLAETTLIAGVGLGLMLLVGAEFIVHVLARGHLQPTIVVLQIQSVAIVTTFTSTTWQYSLLALHHHRASLLTSALGLSVSVILSFALIPALQAEGAAIAFASAEVVLSASAFALLHIARPSVRWPLRVSVRVMLAAALGACTLALPGITSLEATAIAALVYLGVLVVSRAIPAEMLHAIPVRGRPR